MITRPPRKRWRIASVRRHRSTPGCSEYSWCGAAGPYREQNGWLVLENANTPEAREITGIADEFGLVPASVARDRLVHCGLRPQFTDAWIRSTGLFRREDGQIMAWQGSIADKCVALLAHRNEPMDIRTLVDMVGEGHTIEGARNALYMDTRAHRVTRSEWGLRAWGSDDYGGIVDMLARKIRGADGEVKLREAAKSIAKTGGVKESSVVAYAKAPMFVVERGYVRMRRRDEPFTVTRGVRDCAGVFRPAPDIVSMVTKVDRHLLEGNGHSMPAPVGVALGAAPGETLSFRHVDGDIRITWRPTAHAGPTMGSLRTLAARAGAADGDRLRLEFDLSGTTVMAARIPGAIDARAGAGGVSLLTGIPREILERNGADGQLDLVAAASGARTENVRAALEWRGDRELAAMLLPTTVPPPSVPGLAVDDQIDATLPEELAPSSRALYRSHLRAWWRWCNAHGRTPWPARPDDVAEFVRARLASGKGVRTLNSHLVALRTAHRHTGHPDPTRHPGVGEALRAA